MYYEDLNKDMSTEAKSLENFAGKLKSQDKFEKAVQVYKAALKLHRHCEANILRAMGEIQEARYNFQESKECRQVAMKLYHKLDLHSLEAEMAFSVGLLFQSQLNDDKLAEEHYLRALAQLRYNYDSDLEREYCLQIGKLHFDAGRLPQAEFYLQRCIELDPRIGKSESDESEPDEAVTALEEVRRIIGPAT